MKTYEDINTLEDFGIIAGSYTRIVFKWLYPDGDPIPLNEMDSYGCTFSLFGNEGITLFDIDGIIDNSLTIKNTMLIDILSSYTANLDDCVLVYCPYVTSGTKIIKPAQGKIVVAKSTAIN